MKKGGQVLRKQGRKAHQLAGEALNALIEQGMQSGLIRRRRRHRRPPGQRGLPYLYCMTWE